MRLVDAELHGRLFAVLRTTMQATPPLGALLASLTLRYGTVTTVLAAAAMMGVPAAVLGRWRNASSLWFCEGRGPALGRQTDITGGETAGARGGR